MRVLLLGSGGREHALAWRLSQSPSVGEIVAAPGNPGIETVAATESVDASSPAEVLQLAQRVGPGLIVIGPEAPLVAGVGDALREEGFAVLGPSAGAARIEGSKSFAKEVMDSAGIATAPWRSFTDRGDAIAYLDELGPPYVIKADGLAAGKGVVVTGDRDVAVEAVDDRLVRGAFGAEGASIVVEGYLDGEECSLIAFSDGHDVVACEPAQDYKRLQDDDHGPNTGGMGSYSPVPACRPETTVALVDEVLTPAVRELARRGAPFVGALYAGLALTSRGPRVVEFNARFGDPETQALMPRLSSDLGELCLACATGSLAGVDVEWALDPCVTVVLAAPGYPSAPQKGAVIGGLDAADDGNDVMVFHAGTARRGQDLVTAGGRVLTVSATGQTFAAARSRAYDVASRIDFEGKQLRSDIALRAVHAEGAAV